MRTPLFIKLLLLPIAAAAFTGCEQNFYAEVEAPCAISFEDCVKAVAPLLPLDEESFENVAPWWFKGKVAEGFAALAWYPIQLPPQNRIFGGVAPYSIPLWHINIFTRDSNMNKSLFNHVLNSIQTIKYNPKLLPDRVASFTFDPRTYGTMTLHPNSASEFMLPTTLAALYLHEAHHGNFNHNVCEADGGEHCESELSPPYGIEVTYRTMVIHGSGQRVGDRFPLLSQLMVTSYTRESCNSLKTDINTLPLELKTLLNQTNCNVIDISWVTEHEGLTF